MSTANELIVIAEDSATQAVLLEHTLSKHGFRVLAARNGREAFELTIRHRPALVITDIVMPVMDGFELCSSIKAQPELQAIGVIILTALSDPEDIVRALSANADCFLTKPFQEEQLLSQVANVLRNHSAPAEPNDGPSEVEVVFADQRHVITTRRQQILSLLLSTFESAMQKNAELLQTQLDLERLNAELEERVRHRTAALTSEILERQRLEQENARVAESLQLILRTVDEGVCGADISGRITFVNEAAARLLGYRREELIGKHPHALVHHTRKDGRQYPVHECPISACLVTARAFRSDEEVFWRRDGTSFPVEYSVNPIIEDGQIGGVVVSFKDITDRLRNEEAMERRMRRIQILRQIDLAVLGRQPLDSILEMVADMARSELNVDAVSVLLLEKDERMLRFACGRGFRTAPGRIALPAEIVLGAEPVLNQSRILHPSSGKYLGLSGREDFLREEEIIGCFLVPLTVSDETIGVMELFARSPLDPDGEWVQFAEMLAGQLAIAVDQSILFESLRISNEELREAYETTLDGWSRALDLRDKETEGHTLRVTDLTIRLAKEMGLGDDDLVHIRRGALLHDIGKMGVPDAILLKPGALTDEEWAVMKQHPTYARELLCPIAYLQPALEIPYCHHEKWDGTGYPRGLKGDAIPLAARIFAVIDVWDALRSDRPYRQAWPVERVIEHIRSLSGTHFDPVVVDSFLRLMQTEGFAVAANSA